MSKTFSVDLQSFESEIAAFQDAGSQLNANVKSGAEGATDIPTCAKYIEQQRKISELISLYQSLILKDAEDLRMMKESIAQFDAGVAGQFIN